MLQGKQLKMFPTSLPFHGSAVKSSAIQHTYKNSISFTLNYVRIQAPLTIHSGLSGLVE